MSSDSFSENEQALRLLYQRLLDAWNLRDATAFAALFSPDGFVVGFDGSSMQGREQIQAELAGIFASHMTATYVAKVRGVRFLGETHALLRAAAGLLPRGQTAINPAVNALQTLTAELVEGAWRIVQFQNTPAQFHGRPELAQALTAELQALV